MAEEPSPNPQHPAVEGPESGLPHGDADVDALRAELEAAKREAADNLEKLKRTLADFENYRKRSRGEAQAAREKAKEDVLKGLLDVLDNFDRALQHPEDAEGVKLIHRQLQGLLEREGLTRIAAEGEAFDPTRHEAVAQEASATVKAGVVTEEVARGYALNGRVVRPARVKVSSGPPSG